MAPSKTKEAGQRLRPAGLQSSATKSHSGPRNGSTTTASTAVPLQVYNKLLTCISCAFPKLLASSTEIAVCTALIQEIKTHLYNRDFVKAFSSQEYLDAYTVRWSASRALGYIDIFRQTLQAFSGDHALGDDENRGNSALCDEEISGSSASCLPATKITCLGGAAAELCALAGVLALDGKSAITPREGLSLSIRLFDIADWSSVVKTLHGSLTSPRQLSSYASAAAKAANTPLVSPPKIVAAFYEQDVLDWSSEDSTLGWKSMCESDIITIMFTLNELYSISIAKTQRLLLNITSSVQRGTLLLVVDSPGSYSTVTINERDKKYPMDWLMDHTLLQSEAQRSQRATGEGTKDHGNGLSSSASEAGRKGRDDDSVALWEKIVSEESRWFRLPTGLKYPLELENMRYQMHLYRRL